MEEKLPNSNPLHFRGEDYSFSTEELLEVYPISNEFDLCKYTYICKDPRVGQMKRWGLCNKEHIKIQSQIYIDITCCGKFLKAKNILQTIQILRPNGTIFLDNIKTFEEFENFYILTHKSNSSDKTFYDKEFNIIKNSHGIELYSLCEFKNRNQYRIFYKDSYISYFYILFNSSLNRIIYINIYKYGQVRIYNETKEIPFDFYQSETAFSFYKFSLDEKLDGIITNNTIIFIDKYDKIEPLMSKPCLNGKYYKVCTNNKYGILLEGKEICPPLYDDIYCEDNDIYLKKEGFIGTITNSNNIIQPIYEKLIKLKYEYYAYLRNQKWGIINKQNEIILEPFFEEISPLKYEDGDFLCIMKNNTWKVVDFKKKKLIEGSFDYIEERRGIIFVRRGRKM